MKSSVISIASMKRPFSEGEVMEDFIRVITIIILGLQLLAAILELLK